MGSLISASGNVEERNFENVKIGQLQELVGGFVQAFRLDESRWMVVNEEGKFEQLPMNQKATDLAKPVLSPNDFICGTAIVLSNSEMVK